MKPAAFQYAQAVDLAHAVELLAEYGDDAKVIAGGQSLVPLLNMRLARPAVVVDLNALQELDYIRVADGVVAVGALTRHRTLELSAEANQACPILALAMANVAHPQIRNRGTVGGSVAHADPAAELPAVLLALGGQVKAQSVRGERIIKAEDLFTSYFTTCLEADEILTEVQFPIWPGQTGSAFQEVARRHGDLAMVGVAAQVTMDGAAVTRTGIALIGMGPTPVKADQAEQMLVGNAPTAALITRAAAAAVAQSEPDADLHASAEYRHSVAETLAERALNEAIQRARGGNQS